MSDPFPVVYLARHGETAWTISGQHTGVTDLPLTEEEKAQIEAMGGRAVADTTCSARTLQGGRRRHGSESGTADCAGAPGMSH